MNSLLEQFILEARDFLQGIGEKLMALERRPDDAELMTELFRLVHTLKGNSGLFEFPEMTRVLHAGEDLMDSVRDGRVAYSQALADCLLDAMDFVSSLLDEIQATQAIAAEHAAPAEALARALRALIGENGKGEPAASPAAVETSAGIEPMEALGRVPESVLMEAWRRAAAGGEVFHLAYQPEEECFFKGEDPFHHVRQVPGLLWGAVAPRQSWPQVMEFDCYRCVLAFDMLLAAPRAEVDQHFRYTPEQVAITPVSAYLLVEIRGDDGEPVAEAAVREILQTLDRACHDDLVVRLRSLAAARDPAGWHGAVLRWASVILETSPDESDLLRFLLGSLSGRTRPDLSVLRGTVPGLATPADEASAPAVAVDADFARSADAILEAQAVILALPDDSAWATGRIRAAAATIGACAKALGRSADGLEAALAAAVSQATAAPLAAWLAGFLGADTPPRSAETPAIVPEGIEERREERREDRREERREDRSEERGEDRREERREDRRGGGNGAGREGEEVRFGRRAEDALGAKVLKVEQVKVDRLMNLIGEMVVAKNALPYLANRAETQYGVRELSREIKAQYSVINRIAEEMQDAIMQVRMMPVSFVFQRFPRLVRDISRKLGKEVDLVLEGEETEADKNIVEALADPLIHIVRNSLDHGLEVPDVRVAAGKAPAGRLLIRARQESDCAVIEVTDDGRGIDPVVVKRKAYEKHLIDEAQLERMSDEEAVNLVFRAGFSTAETISDLSGRGVGMDVVRNAIDKVGGTIALTSEIGKGTTLRLSLPLSMAVTNVMIVESDNQIFGVPMNQVVETVRLPRDDVRTIKTQKTVVLRDRIVPLVALNDLLAVDAEPAVNGEDELAALVVRIGSEQIGILVDDFREVVDVLLKPLPGELAKIGGYAGTALLGDGSVLMVLNPKELL